MEYDYDVAVIGAGPAGEKAAMKAAYFGKRVALIEREARFGGACGKGGLVSKILRESALMYRGAARRLSDVLAPVARPELAMENLLRAADRVCDAHYEGIRKGVEALRIDWLRGSARFVAPHRLRVAERELGAAVIIVATGSRPTRPAFVPWDAPGVYHADTILAMPTLPKRLVVVGGGVIGTEFASIFAALDVDVHLVEQCPQLLGFLDDDVAEHLAEELRARGAHTYLGTQVVACHGAADGVRVVTDGGRTILADAVLFASGRSANTEDLGLEAVGVALGPQGRPVVDAVFRTSLAHVYAVGDVIGFPALASTGMEQGRVAIGHALRDEIRGRADALPFDDSLPYPLLPYGLYTIPSVAMVGATEAALRAAGTPHVIGVSSYGRQARGHLIGDTSGRLKLIADPVSRRVLGVHIVGETAEELIHIGQACMHYEGTIDYFLRTVFNFPTLAGLYKSAAYDILRRLGSGDHVT